jgi:NAD(P)-dependent dehydrogenase (short-subunit alcohol dehydrogenase family)
MDRYLTGRSALVTGGASGQGRAIALALAARGADVAIGSYLAEGGEVPAGGDTHLPAAAALDAAVAAIAGHGVRALGLGLDVRVPDSCAAFYGRAVAAFGKVDILANAAGLGAEHPLCGHPDPLWDAVIATNLTGCYRMIKLALPGMIERRWGRIVNIASTAANVGAKDNPAYCASKAGLLGLTRCAALEGAPFGVTCNAINPGFVDTAMLRSSVRTWLKAERIDSQGEARSEEDFIAAIAAGYPQKRIIQPREIGALAAFLCHDDALGLTMEDITVAAGSLW